jgi:hypothetical protein
MTLYWLGDAVLILVVLPVVVYLLRPVLATARGILPHVRAIRDAAAAGSKDLDAVPLLLTTQSQVKQTVATVADFGGSLDVILDDA